MYQNVAKYEYGKPWKINMTKCDKGNDLLRFATCIKEQLWVPPLAAEAPRRELLTKSPNPRSWEILAGAICRDRSGMTEWTEWPSENNCVSSTKLNYTCDIMWHIKSINVPDSARHAPGRKMVEVSNIGHDYRNQFAYKNGWWAGRKFAEMNSIDLKCLELNWNCMNIMNEWMNKWMDEWMNEWTNEWMNEWTNERMNEWMNKWTNERMNEWMIEGLKDWLIDWLNDWMIDWMNECMHACTHEGMNEWMKEGRKEGRKGWKKERNEWMYEWLNEWRNERMNDWML